MADSILNTSPILSVCATTGERVKELPIQNGQLIFVQDKHRIALDFNGKRKFYNQIEELNTEHERTSLLAPISGMYYFIIETAVLWTYRGGWVQITTQPENIVFVGTDMPELGKPHTIYVNKEKKEISIWDEDVDTYSTVANYCDSIPVEEVIEFFM